MSTLTISERVKVFFEKYPRIVVWKGRKYRIKRLGLHHSYVSGDILYHVFSVSSDNIFFRLKLDSKNLDWTLEDIENGL